MISDPLTGLQCADRSGGGYVHIDAVGGEVLDHEGAPYVDHFERGAFQFYVKHDSADRRDRGVHRANQSEILADFIH